MSNYEDFFGTDLNHKGDFDVSVASNQYPTDPQRGDFWTVAVGGTLIDQYPSPPFPQAFAPGDHFFFDGGQWRFISGPLTIDSNLIVWTRLDGVITTTPHNVLTGEHVLVNTTSAPMTVVLSPTPNINDRVVLVPAADTYNINSLFVDRNGNPINGLAQSVEVTTQVSIELVFYGGTLGWVMIEQGDSFVARVIDDTGVSIFADISDDGGIGHNHSASLTDAEAQSLIEGTVASVTNSSSFNASHQHLITWQYVAPAIVITAIGTNHIGQEHVGVVINGSGGAGGASPWTEITIATLVEAGDRLLLNYNGGVFNVTLPSTPIVGDEIEFFHTVGDLFASSPVVFPEIDRNGENIAESATNLVINTNYQYFRLVYSGNAGVGWRFV